MSFNSQEIQNMLLITMPDELDKEAAKNFKKEEEEWLKSKVKTCVLDFKKSTRIDNVFYQSMSEFKKRLEEKDIPLQSLYLSKPLLRQIKQDGVHSVFNPMESIGNSSAKTQKPSPSGQKVKLNADLIKPFLNATKSTFESQAKTKLKIESAYLQKEPLKDMSIAGIINLNSKNFKGNIAIRFPEDVFLNIYENMFSEKQEKINDEIKDAAAELLNIVYGGAKANLNEKGFHFEQAIPKVVIGKEVDATRFKNNLTIVMPFSTDKGMFYLEVETLENQMQRSA